MLLKLEPCPLSVMEPTGLLPGGSLVAAVDLVMLEALVRLDVLALVDVNLRVPVLFMAVRGAKVIDKKGWALTLYAGR